MELEITESNFDEYFFDVRQHKPQKNQIIACYTAIAEFVDGDEKRQMMDLLQLTTEKAGAITQVMRKLLFASEQDAFRVPREMVEDFLAGMTRDEVAQKPYSYTMEVYYYTLPEYVPENDPHWSIISLVNLDSFLNELITKDGD